MLAITTLVAALVSEPSEIVLREQFLPTAVHTTIISQCGTEEVTIRMENTQGRVGSRVTEIAFGDAMLSASDLDRLAAIIGQRDIVGAAVVKCGEETNLDKLGIVIEVAEKPDYSYTFVGLEITEDGVEIGRS